MVIWQFIVSWLLLDILSNMRPLEFRWKKLDSSSFLCIECWEPPPNPQAHNSCKGHLWLLGLLPNAQMSFLGHLLLMVKTSHQVHKLPDLSDCRSEVFNLFDLLSGLFTQWTYLKVYTCVSITYIQHKQQCNYQMSFIILCLNCFEICSLYCTFFIVLLLRLCWISVWPQAFNENYT